MSVDTKKLRKQLTKAGFGPSIIVNRMDAGSGAINWQLQELCENGLILDSCDLDMTRARAKMELLAEAPGLLNGCADELDRLRAENQRLLDEAREPVDSAPKEP